MNKTFSSDFDLNEMALWSHSLLYAFSHLSRFCFKAKIPLHLTSGIRSKFDGFSTSATHQSGRACDLRVMHWSKKQMTDVARFLSGLDQVEKIGAVSKSDGIRRLAYFHDNHLHLQVSP